MKTIKGPAIFLAQFCGDEKPFNNLKDIAKWAKNLGYKAVQIPTWDKRIFDLTSEGTNLEKSSLEQMRKKYEKFYSVTDEKFNKDEFEKMVLEENRLITKGIEVGHIFYFGDKYSKAMDAAVDLPGGKKDFVKMGSYGIGVSRLVGAIIEAKYDDKNEILSLIHI